MTIDGSAEAQNCQTNTAHRLVSVCIGPNRNQLEFQRRPPLVVSFKTMQCLYVNRICTPRNEIAAHDFVDVSTNVFPRVLRFA